MWLIWSGVAILLLAMAVSTVCHLHWAHRLPSREALAALPLTPSSCSVIIAARDESHRIDRTLRLLLTQEEVPIEVVVVDDRSTDGTTEIVRQIAETDSRVRLIRIDELPPGWLGKCHACHVGAASAAGDWLLFTDADCWLKPDVLSRALRIANEQQADHIVLTPGISARTLTARAWHVAYVMSLGDWLSGVNRDRPGTYLGMGAFNFVRAEAYRRSGGYEALRLTVLDDVRLGLLLRRAGYRTRGYIGGDDVACDWGSTIRGMIRIMEKNYFAAVDFRTGVAVIVGCGGLCVWALAIAGLFSFNPAGIASGLAMFALAVPAMIVTSRLGWPVSVAFATPLVYPALFYAVLRSTWLTLWRGGVTWRDTHYALETLRKFGVTHADRFVARPASRWRDFVRRE